MLLWLGRSRPVRLGCISYKLSKTNFSVKHSTPRGLFATTNCTERRRCRRWRNSSVRPPSEPFRRRKPTRTPWCERPLTTTKTVRPDARDQGWLSCDRKMPSHSDLPNLVSIKCHCHIYLSQLFSDSIKWITSGESPERPLLFFWRHANRHGYPACVQV